MWRLRNASNFIQTGCEMEELVPWLGYVTDIPENPTFAKFLARDEGESFCQPFQAQPSLPRILVFLQG